MAKTPQVGQGRGSAVATGSGGSACRRAERDMQWGGGATHPKSDPRA